MTLFVSLPSSTRVRGQALFIPIPLVVDKKGQIVEGRIKLKKIHHQDRFVLQTLKYDFHRWRGFGWCAGFHCHRPDVRVSVVKMKLVGSVVMPEAKLWACDPINSAESFYFKTHFQLTSWGISLRSVFWSATALLWWDFFAGSEKLGQQR